ncbi:TonB-dependent receptor [Altericroceibacterium endophyticum]|uniref:TonB-dependent receptor n=1 Tax=Altericroceibacterium endophyticum TaxID=1808508 RepID=A0A6I4T2W2_9SPHN|nr:TonB-dependent receptor [Altericroceibacterium endophyticum]MXO65584.1 TonB-dependent receptor [Altericroceibacterium endophyticum]
MAIQNKGTGTLKTLLKKSALRSASCLQALALVGAGVGMVAVAAPAAAQDYTAGALTGTVVDETGNAVAGATVTITSQAQGFNRTATSGQNGNFRFTGLSSGAYNVEVSAPGLANYRAEGLAIGSSQTTNLSVTLSTGGEIVVTGAQIVTDFEGTTTGLNVDLEDLSSRVPVQRDLTSVILLAPGTTMGDDGFTTGGRNALASIGGSSVAENAYYVNGLNVTNFDNYLGSAQVPFEFLKSVEVKSGGYSAEFGRATGGIVNQVTKSGSNSFEAGMHLNWEPKWGRSDAKDLTECDEAGCYPSTSRATDYTTEYSAIVEASGPIIEDRLFIYGLAEFRNQESRRVSVPANTAVERKNDDPFWGLKIDAYPIDSQHLEFTIFDTRNTTVRNDRSFTSAEGLGLSKSTTNYSYGGVNFVGKYTGNFTDWLTVSAAYGRMRDRSEVVGVAGAAGLPFVRNDSGSTVDGVLPGGFFNDQTISSAEVPYRLEREFYRGDVDLYFNAFGEHHIRAGFDVENNTLEKTSVRTGGAFLFSNGYLSEEAYGGNAGALYLIQPNGQVQVNYYNSGGVFDAENKAFYIQDEWSVTDRLTLNLGLRRDDFKVNRADGEPLVIQDENYAPRLGFTYDLFDDNSGRIYGSYSQYYLPFASNTAFRNTGSEFYFRELWTYDGFDANGIPQLGQQVTNNATYQGNCPVGLTPTSSGENCLVTGDGSVPPSDSTIARGLDATKSSEWIIGYEQRLGQFKVGINYTHRSLDEASEDVAVDAAVLNYCDENGIAGCDDIWTGFHQYTFVNPGEDATFNLYGLDGREVTFTAEQLGYPKPKRTYDGVTFSFDREWDGIWSVGGSYTWSESKGNYEGFVSSDFEQDDAGATQDFDQPALTEYAYGYLPNHRRHRFKLFGAVSPWEGLLLGANAYIDSPRKLSCLGWHPTDAFAGAYEDSSHYCGGEPSPRGTAQETDWVSRFDVRAAYTVEAPTGQMFTFRVDVYNLLNAQAVTGRDEFGDQNVEYDDDQNIIGYVPNPSYGLATGYQTPRYVRFGMDIAF